MSGPPGSFDNILRKLCKGNAAGGRIARTGRIASKTLIREHLANERTYLAWLRTSFALLTLGFATNKFGKFLTELRLRSERELPRGFLVGSERFGLGMVILATVLMALASWQYQKTRRAIEAGTFQPASTLIWIIGGLSLLFGLTAVALVLQT